MIVWVALAALVAATLQSATSFGFALVLAPVLLAVVEPAEAISTVLILAAALNLMMLFGEGRLPNPRWRELGVLLVATIPGMLTGVVILGRLSKPTLQLAAGVAVVAAGLILLRQEMEDGPLEASERWRLMGAGAGLAAGLLATTTSTNGPPIVMFMQRLGLTPMQMRDSITAAFLVVNAVAAGFVIGLAGEVGSPDLLLLAALLVASAIGRPLGRRIFDRLEPRRFRRAGLALVLAAGIASAVAGIVG